MNTTAHTDVKRLFETGAHFAQVKSRRHPSMKPYVIGTKGRTEIIDLEKTLTQLEVAKGVMETLAREGKTILFVGSKTEIASFVKKAAEEIGQPYVTTRWLGGTISNFPEIKKRIERLAEIVNGRADGTLLKRHTKLELVFLAREEERLSKRLDGIAALPKRPDALVVVDPKHERHAIKEAQDASIPIIALMSSDCDVKDATYPVVINDASREAVALGLKELTAAFAQGRTA